MNLIKLKLLGAAQIVVSEVKQLVEVVHDWVASAVAKVKEARDADFVAIRKQLADLEARVTELEKLK